MVSKDHPELMEEIVPRPIIKSYVEESPEAPDSEKRDAFFEHKKQFLIITAAGKPIFTRYGEEGGVSALCASFAAVIPKLQNQYYDQRLHTSLNTIRYIKTSQMLAVFLFKRNLVYIGLSKSGHSYTFLQRQLEVLHTQLLSMITEKPNTQLTYNPSLDVKSYLDANVAHETDQTLSMSIKFSSQTPYSFMCGFPVLRVSPTLRSAVTKIMLNNKPESMLFVLLSILNQNRLGMLVTNCSYITIIRENDIVIDPYDMNLILITILAQPSIRRTDTSSPICLPGIADDGYLYFTIKYMTPNIGIIFASLSPEDFYESLAKANTIAQELRTQGLLADLTRAVQQNYSMTLPIVPNELGNDIKMAVVRHNLAGQICTLNFPIFCNSKEKRKLLRKVADAYFRTEDPTANKTDFEYIERNGTEVVHVSVGEGKTIVLLASINMTNKELVVARDKIRKKMEVDEPLFFISKY